ncbi:hypothetical protein [Afipia sp. OHSU_I-C6]|uniref:hypothetical protein n=1 Tax=Afipia sp. OHSU_I-C6 TaxID=1297864 RepID=UPI001FCB5E95|nr:hypothetical protein [Afipia sp. OHSU_I-C6]
MTLTAAGAELRASIEGPLQIVGEAAENLNRFRDAPMGRVRINILEDAVPLLLDPVMPIFVDRYPEVEVDISVSNRRSMSSRAVSTPVSAMAAPCRKT